MSAQILSLPTPPRPQLLLEQVSAPQPVLAAHPLQTLLCQRMADEAEDLMRGFVDSLDSALQALLAESRNASETRAVLDLGHALSLNRPTLLRGFVATFRSRFDPLRRQAAGGVFDLERLCLLPSEELEENVALAHLTSIADQTGGEDGRQVLARLQWAARDLVLPALAEALAPQALPECFAQAFRKAGLATTDRVLAYRLVETHALPGWALLMQHALGLLDQQGLRMARPLAATAAQDAAPMISSATLQTLREARASLVSGSDGALATALLRAIEPPCCGNAAALITALAGAWMDHLLAEPELPAAFAPDLESLRLIVIKAALCDVGFFAHALHPVRRAVDELTQRAAFIGLQGYSLAPLRAELKAVAARVSVHGQFALDALSMLPPLDSELAHGFRLQMGRDQSHRREALLLRVRNLATREIEARTLDVALPPAARAALTRGFLPLLSTLLLRFGGAAAPTRQTRQLLERFVDSFALCVRGDERRAVVSELCTALLEAGLPDLHVNGVSAELEKAYAELEAEAESSLPQADCAATQREINDILVGMGIASEAWQGLSAAAAIDHSRNTLTPITASNDLRAVPVDADPLAALLKPGQWFRVRDYKRGDDRWLSLTGVHRELDRLSFSGFDGATALALRASQFIEDLKSGLAEPLNPDAVVQQAIQRLRAAPQGTMERLHHFG